jgi:hypothetical protein
MVKGFAEAGIPFSELNALINVPAPASSAAWNGGK